MFDQAKTHYAHLLDGIRTAGLWKEERVLASPQGAQITVAGRAVLNFCANNYLGLSDDPRLIAAAHAGLDQRGYGLSSVRFICGTQDAHKELEAKISAFLGTQDTILHSSCFDANGGFFEAVLGPEDAVISDALNHASIIDGIRLCKAQRLRYAHDDMADLRAKLAEAHGARVRLIATDGVFSMDGDVARLDDICTLADQHRAMVFVDDSHGTGVLGKRGRGTHEHRACMERVDVISSTLGKALGGAAGGFISGRREIIDLLRNRSRPYLFSNTLPPPIVAASLAALDLIGGANDLRDRLETSTARFRAAMTHAGFSVRAGVHPIVPIMIGEAGPAVEFARRLLDEGIYVIGFSYPVVPQGLARIRAQISAAHTPQQIDTAVAAFGAVGRRMGLL